MIQAANNKQGRNALCNCGSGRKFKKCCGQPCVVTLGDMMKCLYLLLEGASESVLAIPKGPIPFSRDLINKVPDDVVNEIMVAEKAGFLVLTVKKKNEPLISVPNIKQISELGKKT